MCFRKAALQARWRCEDQTSRLMHMLRPKLCEKAQGTICLHCSIQTSILQLRGATWTSLISNKHSKPQRELSSISALPLPFSGFLSSVKGSTIHLAACLENWSECLTFLSSPPATSTPVVLRLSVLLENPTPSLHSHCHSLAHRSLQQPPKGSLCLFPNLFILSSLLSQRSFNSANLITS